MQKVEGSSPFTRSNPPLGDEAEGRGDVLCRLPFASERTAPGRRSQVVRQRSAKPPSSVQLRSPPPTTSLHLAISGRARSRTILPNRQNCRQVADKTRRHALPCPRTSRTQPSFAARGSDLCSLSFAHFQARGSVIYRKGPSAVGAYTDCLIVVRHSTGGSLWPEGTRRPASLDSGLPSVSPSAQGSALRSTTSPSALAADSCSEWRWESPWGSSRRSSMPLSRLVVGSAHKRLRERDDKWGACADRRHARVSPRPLAVTAPEQYSTAYVDRGLAERGGAVQERGS